MFQSGKVSFPCGSRLEKIFSSQSHLPVIIKVDFYGKKANCIADTSTTYCPVTLQFTVIRFIETDTSKRVIESSTASLGEM